MLEILPHFAKELLQIWYGDAVLGWIQHLGYGHEESENFHVWQLLDLLVKYGALCILEFYRHFVMYKSGFMLLQL